MNGCSLVSGIGVFISVYLLGIIPMHFLAEKLNLNDKISNRLLVVIAIVCAMLIANGPVDCSGDGYSAPEVTGRTMR
jgi:hypothetical protein